MQLSVIIPVFNEENTIREVIERIAAVPLCEFELIVVDDGSTDGTARILQEIIPNDAQLVIKPKNEGKTSAVRTGLALARGNWIIVQDADLEYDPNEIQSLLNASGKGAPVVYGQRPSYWNRPSRWLFATGVLVVDIAILIVYRKWVRDHATCYKLVPRNTLESFQLESSGFEGCVEITAKLLRSKIPIRQVPISYKPRLAAEGKKLTPLYGLSALCAVLRYRRWVA